MLATETIQRPQQIEMMTVEIYPLMGTILNGVVAGGEAPTQKITHLLLSEVYRHLEACERELEIAVL